MGTFALVFFGCGAIVVNDVYGVLGHGGVCAVFGLIVMAVIYAVGNVSGAHINPAVTVGFLFAGRFKKRDVVPYIASQCIGALLAALVLRVIWPEQTGLGATLPAGGMLQAFVLEVLLTFFLMFVILNVSTGHMEKGIMAGVAVGGMVALEALMGGPVSGASMNPARSFGPAVVSGQWTGWWIYLVAPMLGAFLAHPCCRCVQGKVCCELRNDLKENEG
jgi:aquaporin Z